MLGNASILFCFNAEDRLQPSDLAATYNGQILAEGLFVPPKRVKRPLDYLSYNFECEIDAMDLEVEVESSGASANKKLKDADEIRIPEK